MTKIKPAISIIIPFYNGNKYLNGLRTTFDNCAKKFKYGFEVIIVNDSPLIKVNTEQLTSKSYELISITNPENSGIQKSRINGLTVANGDYVLFLDQDDYIFPDFLLDMYEIASNTNADLVISNGIYETQNGNHLIFDSYGKVNAAKHIISYCILGNLLCSPGQTIIKKSAIPAIWKNRTLHTNCSDDFYLWLLMIKKRKPEYCNKILYKHVYTGENESLNKINGIASDREMIEILKSSGTLSHTELNLLSLRNNYLYNKMVRKEDKVNSYSRYMAIYIFYKTIIKINGVMLQLIGYKVPKIRNK